MHRLNYDRYINDSLEFLMPVLSVNEDVDINKMLKDMNYDSSSSKISKAPKITGYFGFIALRYMKRVNDIKSMCVEYINTKVISTLNAAKKMDSIDVARNMTKLAANLKDTINTYISSTSIDADKKDIAFLINDKSLVDKINSIKAKIEKRASKSEYLKKWAELMLIQSDIIAAEITYRESNKLIEDSEDSNVKKELDNAKSEKENALELANKKLQEQLDEANKMMKDLQLMANTKLDPSAVTNTGINKNNIKELLSLQELDGFNIGDYNRLLDENHKIIMNDLMKMRADYYNSKWETNFDDLVYEYYEKVENAGTQFNKEFENLIPKNMLDAVPAIHTMVHQILLSWFLASKQESNVLSPVDIKILRDTDPNVKIKTRGTTPIDGYTPFKNSDKVSKSVKNYQKILNLIGVNYNKILPSVPAEWLYIFDEKISLVKDLTPEDETELKNENAYYNNKNRIFETRYVLDFNSFMRLNESKQYTQEDLRNIAKTIFKEICPNGEKPDDDVLENIDSYFEGAAKRKLDLEYDFGGDEDKFNETVDKVVKLAKARIPDEWHDSEE